MIVIKLEEEGRFYKVYKRENRVFTKRVSKYLFLRIENIIKK